MPFRVAREFAQTFFRPVPGHVRWRVSFAESQLVRSVATTAGLLAFCTVRMSCAPLEVSGRHAAVVATAVFSAVFLCGYLYYKTAPGDVARVTDPDQSVPTPTPDPTPERQP